MSDATVVAPPAVTPPASPATTPAAPPAVVTPPASPKQPEVVNRGRAEPVIPKHRLDEVSAKLKTAEAELERLRALNPEGLQALNSRLTGQLSFARVGVVDEEHVEAVTAAWSKLPAEGKPASAVEFWQGITTGAIQAPRTLLGFMPAAPAAGAPGAATAPRLPAAPTAPPAAGPTVTQAQVQAAQDAFRASPTADNKKRMLELTAALQAANKPAGA